MNDKSNAAMVVSSFIGVLVYHKSNESTVTYCFIMTYNSDKSSTSNSFTSSPIIGKKYCDIDMTHCLL